MTTAAIKTKGMHCSSCVKLVEMAVGDLDGVESVKADLGEQRADVVYDPDKVKVDAILTAIREAGYGAELESA